VEHVTDHDAVARADRDLRLEDRVPDGHEPLVHFEIVGDDLFLHRRLVLRDDLGRDRVGQRLGQLLRPVLAVRPAEVAVDDVHVREQVRDRARVRVPLHVVEQHGVAAVEMLLHAGELEVAIDQDVGLEEEALAAKPLDRRRKRTDVILARAWPGEVGRDAVLRTAGLRFDGHAGSSYGRMVRSGVRFREYNG